MASKKILYSDMVRQRAGKQGDEHEVMRTMVDSMISESGKKDGINTTVLAQLVNYILPPLIYEGDYSQADYETRVERLRNFVKAIFGIQKEENNVCTTVTEKMCESFSNVVQWILTCIDQFRPKTKDETYFYDMGDDWLDFVFPKTFQDIYLGLNYWPALHKLIGPSPYPMRLYACHINQAIRMVNIMFGLNQHWGVLFGNLTKQKIVPDSTFQTFRFFSDYEDFSRLGWNLSFERNQPFLFSSDLRQEIFRRTLRMAYPCNMSPFFAVHARSSRDNVLTTVGSIVSEKDKYSHWLFKFDNEEGERLGPTKEFYTKFSQDICRYDLNLWIGEPQISSNKIEHVTSPCGLFPSPCLKLASDSRDILTAIGIIMAKALLEYKLLDLNFSSALYKCIVGGSNNFPHLNLNDLKDVMPSLAKFVDGLVEVRKEVLRIKNDTSLTSEQQREATSDLKCDGCSFEDLCINFTLPGFSNIEMVEGGANKFLSADNVEEYLKLLVWWFMYKGPQEKLECIKAGFESILDKKVFSNIVAEDLEKLLCGTREKPWTVSELMQNCMLDDLELESPLIKNLFKVFSCFSSEEQRLFLTFATGSPNLPIGGFASLMPKLRFHLGLCQGDPNQYLLMAFTCGHLLVIQKHKKRHSRKDVVIPPMEKIMFDTLPDELSLIAVNNFMVKCRHMLTDGLSGLQLTDLGLFCCGVSQPRFVAERNKFVQIINVGDHWTCCTNLFSDVNYHVYIYDSWLERVNDTGMVLISSLLRMENNAITISMKTFAQQARGSRYCGYYACAALFLILCGIDPSFLINDIIKIKKLYYGVINNQIICLAPLLDFAKDTRIKYSQSFEKLICVCQKKATDYDAKCSKCDKFYHLECMNIKHLPNEWIGPCCRKYKVPGS